MKRDAGGVSGGLWLASTDDLLGTSGWRELLADFTTGPQTRSRDQGNAGSG